MRLLLTAVLAIALAACSRAPGPGTGGMAPTVGVATAVVRPVRQTDDFTGRLEATETVAIRPRVGGYIDRVHFRAGQEVRKGELLLSIDASIYRAEVARATADLAAAHARAGLARLEDARSSSLIAEQAISQQERDQLSAALAASTASVQAAAAALKTATLNLGYTEIRSPISGRISRALVTEGNLVSAGASVLATIESMDRMYAYFDASEAVFLKYSGQSTGPVRSTSRDPVPIHMGLLGEEGYPHDGAIESFDNRLAIDTGAIRARAVFDNGGRAFTPGLYARLRLETGEPVPSVLVPERAIGTDQSRRFVMVVGADDVASYRAVQLGSAQDGMRVVVGGLNPGERFIVDGLQRARPGSKVKPEDELLDGRGQVVPAAASRPAASGR